MDLCHLKNSELEPQYQKYKGRVVLRGDVVKDDSGSYAVFTEQGSSASQMTALKIMDFISRLTACTGQAADAVSAYTQVKMEDDAPTLLKIPMSVVLSRDAMFGWPSNSEKMKMDQLEYYPQFANIFLKCRNLASIGRPDNLWSVNIFARAGNEMDESLWQTFSAFDLLHSGNIVLWVTLQQCRKGLFQDSDFAADLEDSKSQSGRFLCILGSQTFVPISWMCKKQTSVSHSSTEAELKSLDAGWRMDGIPALDLWDLVIEVFHSSPNQTNKTKNVREPRGKLVGKTCENKFQPRTPISIWPILITFHQAEHIPVPKLCCTGCSA